ncbi:hypothetical protein F4859DRAFT_520234 [Xylaria cf. heliscus]|nr:hypothetical protein F4859DRAFT_520234 [Xylaria cf. heliscus]
MGETWWDEFSNNLATDLMPLIALFGEAPTKQYLSESLTTEDIIIFAVAPLGVITAIVSAIRVCGTSSLRAFVGRAQEGARNAEAELCSSTSRDVCELYSNGGIARVFGRPKLLEIVHDPQASYQEFYPTKESDATAGIYSFRDYVKGERGKQEWILQQGTSSRPGERGSGQQTRTRFAPNPNLSLNIGIKPLSRSWFIAASAFGTMLQYFVLIWATLTRYYYQWIRHSREDDYAVPFTVVGTILLCLGMALCANLIETKTEEHVYQRVKKSDSRGASKIYWVQPGNQTIGDQVFDSFAYSDAEHTLERYIISWKFDVEDSNIRWTWTAVAMSSTGFVFLFLGLRACHSSVSIAQLGATILMSLIRAGLRVRRLKKEDNFMWISPDLFKGHELDWLALKLGRSHLPGNVLKRTTAQGPTYSLEVQSRRLWNIFDNADSKAISSTDISSNYAMQETGEPNDLETVLEVDEGPSISGFRIKTHLTNQPLQFSAELVDKAEEELLSWISTKNCAQRKIGHDCSAEYCKRDVNIAVKTVMYRSRLARMTGIGEPESGRSSHWGAKFVSVRDAAIALAHCIDDTMHILFDSTSQSPVKLHDSWEHTFRIFWTVQCSLLDPLVGEPLVGDIHMSLRREIDHDGIPEGLWKSDKSELEAVLGLWLWSLKEPPTIQDVEEAYSMRTGQRISRIIFATTNPKFVRGDVFDICVWRKKAAVKIREQRLKGLQDSASNPKHTNAHKVVERRQTRAPAYVDSIRRWIPIRVGQGTAEGIKSETGETRRLFDDLEFDSKRPSNSPYAQNDVWWRDNQIFVTNTKGPPAKSHDQRRFFGWCNMKERRSKDDIFILEIPSERSLLLNCAQDIYSMFLKAIMHAVQNIGGNTTAERHKDDLFITNDRINQIRNILVSRGLCDMDDSFTCIVPILSHQDKIEYPDEALAVASDLAERWRGRMNKRARDRAQELGDWCTRRSNARSR